MANSAQARKRARQATKARAHNASLRSRLRTAIKAVRKAIVGGDKAAAQSVFRTSMSTIDTIADKNIIHKNKAARHKSRLSAAIFAAMALLFAAISFAVTASWRSSDPWNADASTADCSFGSCLIFMVSVA